MSTGTASGDSLVSLGGGLSSPTTGTEKRGDGETSDVGSPLHAAAPQDVQIVETTSPQKGPNNPFVNDDEKSNFGESPDDLAKLRTSYSTEALMTSEDRASGSGF